MKAIPLPDIDELRRLFDVNFDTGVLTWRKRDDVKQEWNTKYAGTQAGCLNKIGYFTVRIQNKLYAVSRIIFKMFHKIEPEYIDHINGIRHENKIVNLRSVTKKKNQQNTKRPINNTSGIIGVSWDKRMKKWNAYIKSDGVRKNLGYFDNISEAATARADAEIKHGFHPNHGRAA